MVRYYHAVKQQPTIYLIQNTHFFHILIIEVQQTALHSIIQVNYKSNSDKVIASCGQDGRIVLVSSQRNQSILAEFSFEGIKNTSMSNGYGSNSSSINCCLFSPHSKYIAAGSVDSMIKIWQMKNHKDVYLSLKSHMGGVSSLAWSRDEQVLFSSSITGDIFVHSVKTGSVMQQISLSGQEQINCIRLSEGQNYNRLAACTNSGSVIVWDLDHSKGAKQSILFENSMKVAVTSLTFSTFSPALLVTSSIDQNLTFYDISVKKAVKTIATEQPLTAVNFYSDGHTLIAGGMYGGLFLYDLRKPQKPKQKFQGHETAIKYIDFHKEKVFQPNISMNSSKEGSFRQNKEFKGNIKEEINQKAKNTLKQKQKSLNEQNLKREEIKKVKQLISQKQQKFNSIPQKLQPQSLLNFENNLGNEINNPKNNELQTIKTNILLSLNEKFELLHLEIIKQFQIQQYELKKMLERQNQSLKAKDQYIKKLQDENAKLKKNRY